MQQLSPSRLALPTLVQLAQAELLFERSRNSNLLNPAVALLVAWLLWGHVSASLLVAWVVAKFALTICRHAQDRAYRSYRANRQMPAGVERCRRRLIALLALDGLSYGCLGTVLQPADHPVLSVALVATVIAACAVGLVVLSSSLSAAVAFTVPALLPSIVWQAATGSTISLYMAGGMAIFLLLLVTEARRASMHVTDMLRLRFRMDELAEQRHGALQEAHRSSEVKTRFLATMSHEMRTPLHGILGLARLLRDGGDAALQARRLAALEQTGRHLLAVINDVLDFSRIESGRVELARRPMDLKAVATQALEMCRVAAEDKGLVLRGECSLPAPSWVLGDADRLSQVLLNLLGNAVKFTDRGHVTLRCALDGAGNCTLEVLDSGPGVPPAARERIFQPFEQIDGTDARRFGGTGLGLTIARDLAVSMGGELCCDAAPRGGALFRLTLPLEPCAAPACATLTLAASASPAGTVVDPTGSVAGPPDPGIASAAASDAAGAAEEPDDPRTRVLLAEDNPVNALVATTLLEGAGIAVSAVGDGAAAVQAAMRPPRPAMVLMDCQMPGMDGFEATRRIRRHEAERGLARLPIVALTANALPGDRDRSLAAGMDDHLAKPFDREALMAMVGKHLPRVGA